MNNTGKRIARACCSLLVLVSTHLAAAVTATVDRTTVAMGDSLQLTISADDGENIKQADLRPLLASFDILQRASSSNFSLVNGKRSRTEQLQLQITPQREGALSIPPMRIGKSVTNALKVQVNAAPTVDAAGQTVIFEAEVDRAETYVQGQVILTLRLQQAINLDNRSISELELDNAFIKELEQKSFQRNVDGRQWLVHEVRYAIFPEQSGTLEIPAQTFTARIRENRRTLFDISRGRSMRRSTEPLAINVLPRPTSYSASNWLPARQVTLEEQWSTPPETLRAGESATRTIRIQGEGVQGAQLPPVFFTAVDGLKFYPDQPQINDHEISTGLIGTRIDSTAILPTRAGNFSIPEVRIPWWDTESAQLRHAVLPGREINVAPGEIIAVDPTSAAVRDSAAGGATLHIDQGDALPWQVVSAVSTCGWLITLLWFWRQRRRESPTKAADAGTLREKQVFKQLLHACNDGDAAAARMALIQWTAALSGKTALSGEVEMVSIEQATAWHDDEALRRELAGLEQSLYGSTAEPWRGAALAECAQRLRKTGRHKDRQGDVNLALYPDPA